MQVLQVQEYNSRGQSKWGEAVDRWHERYGYGTNGGMPWIGCYTFCTNTGNFRQSGYVVFNDRASVWQPTKHEAIAYFIKSGYNK